jgi:hypothetical protein
MSKSLQVLVGFATILVIIYIANKDPTAAALASWGVVIAVVIAVGMLLWFAVRAMWRRSRIARALAWFALAALVVMVMAAAIGIDVRYYYEVSTTELVSLFGRKPLVQQTEYAGLRLGMSPDEVMYIKGYPPQVLGEPDKDGEWKGDRPVIATNQLQKGKRVEDYDIWSYENDQSRIDVIFNPEKTTVIAIECYSNDRLRRCPSVAGVSDGDSEQQVIRKLGPPDASYIMGITKSLNYRTLGLILKLTKEQVYWLAIHDPKYAWRASN